VPLLLADWEHLTFAFRRLRHQSAYPFGLSLSPPLSLVFSVCLPHWAWLGETKQGERKTGWTLRGGKEGEGVNDGTLLCSACLSPQKDRKEHFRVRERGGEGGGEKISIS